MQLRRSLKTDEYVVYRGRNGRVRKFRSDVLLVAEVWSKKTGKPVLSRGKKAVLNATDKKSGKPTARRFTSLNRVFLEKKPVEISEELIADGRSGEYGHPFFEFDVGTAEKDGLIVDQIPEDTCIEINNVIRVVGKVGVRLWVDAGNGIAGPTETHVWSRPVPHERMQWIFAVLVRDKAMDMQIRTSPKKFWKRNKKKRWKKPRWIECRVQIAREP